MVIEAGGDAKTGAIVSLIVIVCVTDEVLPHESLNVQVLVIIAGQVPTGALSEPTTVPEGTQLSV